MRARRKSHRRTAKPTAATPGTPPEQQSDRKSAFEPITSQAELDRVLSGRLDRERAKFADYEAMKAKASQFDEIEEANKSELQKQLTAPRQRSSARLMPSRS